MRVQTHVEMDTFSMLKRWHIFKNGRSGNYFLSFRDNNNHRKQRSLHTQNKQEAKLLAVEWIESIQNLPASIESQLLLSEFTRQI